MSKEDYSKLLSSYELTFEPNDIKYIILKEESEISEFINIIETIYGRKYSVEDVSRLKTRIITSDQIKNDF